MMMSIGEGVFTVGISVLAGLAAVFLGYLFSKGVCA